MNEELISKKPWLTRFRKTYNHLKALSHIKKETSYPSVLFSGNIKS